MIWEILSLSRLQKMLKLGDSLLGKHALERKPRVWLDKLATAWKGSEGQSILLRVLFKRFGTWLMDPSRYFSRSQEQRWDYIGKRTLLSSEVSCDIHRRPTKFLRMLYQQKLCRQGLKGTREGEIKESSLKILGNMLICFYVTQLQTCATLQEKGAVTVRTEVQVQRVELRALEDYFQALKPNGVC